MFGKEIPLNTAYDIAYKVMQMLDTASRAKFAMTTKLLYKAFLPTFIFEQYKSDYEAELRILVALYWEGFNEERFQNTNLPLIKSIDEASSVYKAVSEHNLSDLFSLILKVTALGKGMDIAAYSYVARLLPDINARHKSGNTVLHFAVVGGNITYMAFLLTANANTDLQNNKGETPLHLSIIRGAEYIKILTNANANPFIVNNEGFTPLHLAEVREHYSCMEALLDYQERLEGNAEALAFSGF